MALDPVKNFAISRVATAPSPAASGTTLVVETGDGVLFPDPSSSGDYNVVIYPNGEQPTSSNAEIVRVTARSTDTMTITREQESSSARTIVEGDVVMLGITAKVVSDIQDTAESAVVAGIISMYGGSTAPTGYLLCDGSAVSRSTYSDLYTAIGTTYGTGDGSTTFNVPNLKGKVPVGYNSADTSFDALGETGGAKTHTLTIAEMPDHDHGLNRAYGGTGFKIPYDDPYSGWGMVDGGGSSPIDVIKDEGGGEAHNNLQPYIVLNYIIRT
jgi:microcystin-dependent protein